MLTLIAGLLLFLGAHSVRIMAEDWRTATVARLGEKTWKGVYSLVSLAGFVLIVVGFGLARYAPVVLWPQPPVWLRHVAALLVLVSFVLLAAAYVPGNAIKARLRHPMVLGVKLWAFAHLIVNNTLADTVLFGAFLVWAVLDFRAARGRDSAGGSPSPQPSPQRGEGVRTGVAVGIGLVAWAVFAFWAHRVLIGVSPLGA
jgi:uncharacterized membrane protein